MKPLLVIDGKPRLYEHIIQYTESIRTGTSNGFLTTAIVPNSTWAQVWLRNHERLTLRGNPTRSIRPSGRVMYSWSSIIDRQPYKTFPVETE